MGYLSQQEQQRAAEIVQGAILAGRVAELLAEAHKDLEAWRDIAFRRKLTPAEDHETNILIELAVRAEGAISGGGTFFRFRRRLALTRQYFG